jgi:hypothetical protein
MTKKLVFDVMLNERYICTLRIPITFDMIEEIDETGVVVRVDRLQEIIEEKRPTLRGKNYKIEF